MNIVKKAKYIPLKVIILSLLLLIFVLLCSACSQLPENIPEPPPESPHPTLANKTDTSSDNNDHINDLLNGDIQIKPPIQVDKSKVIISDEVQLPVYFPAIPPNSYAITQTQSYEKWTRTYAVYYPLFTDEIKYAGSEIIKNYYAELAQSEKERGYWEMEDMVVDRATNLHNYYCKSYEVGFFEPYLTVLYFRTAYYGGAHSLEYYSVDNFDMISGELITMTDLFGEEDTYRPILNRLICEQLLSQIDFPLHVILNADTDIMSYSHSPKLQFRICSTGIEFIFQIYEIASYADGAIFVNIPYEDLEPILAIDLQGGSQHET